MHFDVVVVGAGHAGVEAAASVSRLGLNIALITFSKTNIGEMSCNPSIGGLGKGHLVREIDALDGVMARAIDKAGTQFKMLNSSKGAAVQGLRAQADRKLYKKAVNEILSEYNNLKIIEGEVTEILFDEKYLKVKGVVLNNKEVVISDAVVVTTGTFLNGVMHFGKTQTLGGRIGENNSKGITESLKRAGFSIYRLKTGTPARLLKSSINYKDLILQEGDENPEAFSYLTECLSQKMIPCYITYTNAKTHEILLKNKDEAPLYNGQIKSIGPRYCPSIEDKVVRFKEHPTHHIFLEQEGYDSNVIYPNGISTSMPKEVQDEFIHSIAGLENVEILQYGYAIEYDTIDPRELLPTLSSKRIKGLYFAGQINGTSGYEEAACQGILAGINTALFVKQKEELILDRSQAYIGVLVDDITTLGVDEPYRMFTSRSEYRLSIRQDNADLRLTPIGINLGVISENRKEKFLNKLQNIEGLKKLLMNCKLTTKDLKQIDCNECKTSTNAYELLKYSDASILKLKQIIPSINDFKNDVVQQVEIEGKYQGYLKRQQQDIDAYKKDQNLKLPINLDYNNLASLNRELKEKLLKSRPVSLASASRIPGMTPAALTALLQYVKKNF